MSNSNQVTLTYKEQTAFGTVTDPSGATAQLVSFTSEGFKEEADFARSSEIRADRNVVGSVRTARRAVGEITKEIQPTSTEVADMFQYGLHSAGYVAAVAAETKTVTLATKTFTIAGAGTWTNAPATGDWIEVNGSGIAKEYLKVASSTSGTVVVEQTPAGEYSSLSTTFSILRHIVNGTEDDYVEFKKEFEDLAGTHAVVNYQDMRCDSLGVSMTAGEMATMTTGWSGVSEVSNATQFETQTAAATTVSLNSVDHIEKVEIAGTSGTLLSFSFDVGNNLRTNYVLGTNTPNSIGSGFCDVSGTITLYYATKTVPDYFLDNTQVSMAVVLNNGGVGYILDFPAVVFNSMQRLASGPNGDVICEMGFDAIRHATLGHTIKIARF